jgi:hypothetical protein
MAQRKNSGRTQQRTPFSENRNASATKAGPGRFHVAGCRKSKPARDGDHPAGEKAWRKAAQGKLTHNGLR